MKCWHCNKKLIWGGDHTYEDYCMGGDGIVSNLTCPNDDCGVETVLVYCNLTEEKEEQNNESIQELGDDMQNRGTGIENQSGRN